jgi:hypothetical protein
MLCALLISDSIFKQHSFVGWAKARLRRAHRTVNWWARCALPTLRKIADSIFKQPKTIQL